ncbi:MAG: septal ring lytic transglycosylase RlpA family protein [Nitrospirae bacterium]|nr:septal ring lytic transglycosylase RlpA family protein [Nitrospirota bacterium]
MRSLAILIISAIVAIYGCAHDVKVPPKRDVHVPPATLEEPPQVLDRTSMVASWYGPDFHGKLTASGEVYDMYAMTAAHKTLPFGTILKLTNPESGASATVTITDRGPFIPGRDIDLSYSAARELGVVAPGTLTLMVQYLSRDMKYAKYIRVSEMPGSAYTIQIASFEDKQAAERLKGALDASYAGVFIKQASVNGKTVYRVRLGRYAEKDKAIAYAKLLANEGYDTFVTPGD